MGYKICCDGQIIFSFEKAKSSANAQQSENLPNITGAPGIVGKNGVLAAELISKLNKYIRMTYFLAALKFRIQQGTLIFGH